MTDRAATLSPRRRFLLVFAAIFLIAAVPATMVQWLIRTSPPGAQVSDLAQAVNDALDAVPAPHGEALPLAYDLEVGSSWVLRVRAEPLSEGSGRDAGAAGLDAAPLGGRFRFRVQDRGLDGDWRVRVEVLESARPVERALQTIVWSADGRLRFESDESDVRQVLLAELGVVVPGPFRGPCRLNEKCQAPATALSLPALLVKKRLDLELGPETFPALGGLFFVSGSADSEDRAFESIAYRKYGAEGPDWVGAFESVWRGSLRAPRGHLERVEGELRLHERFRLSREPRTTADSELVVRLSLAAESD